MPAVTVNNSTYTPFSFQEMIAPLMLYKQEYDAIDKDLTELSDQASVWEKLRDSTLDQDTYRQYDNYIKELRKVSEALYSQGLDLESRGKSRTLRSRYKSEIVPISEAYAQRQKLSEVYRDAKLKDKTLRTQRDPKDIKLSELIADPTMDWGESFSGNELYATVSKEVSNFKNSLLEQLQGISDPAKIKKKLQSLGLPFQYERYFQYGATPALVDQAINQIMEDARNGNPTAMNFLSRPVENAVAATGVHQWGTKDQVVDAYNFASRALYDSIGKPEVRNYTDTYSQDIAKLQYKAQQDRAEQERNEAKGLLPLNLKDLVSANLQGDKGASEMQKLLNKLGISFEDTIKLSRGENVELGRTGNLPAYREYTQSISGGVGSRTIKTNNPGNRVKLWRKNGTMYSKQEFMQQGQTSYDQKILGQRYDALVSEINKYDNRDALPIEGYTVSDIQRMAASVLSGQGPLSIKVADINFGADQNIKIATQLVTNNRTSTGSTPFKEIRSIDKTGAFQYGQTLRWGDLFDGDGNAKPVSFNLSLQDSAQGRGIIMIVDGKQYHVPLEKLGSLGTDIYDSGKIQQLRQAIYNDQIAAQEVIQALSGQMTQEEAYQVYKNSREGYMAEAAIRQAWSGIQRSIGTAMSYNLKPASYNIVETKD